MPACQGTYSLSSLRYQASFKAVTVSSRPALGEQVEEGRLNMDTHTQVYIHVIIILIMVNTPIHIGAEMNRIE